MSNYISKYDRAYVPLQEKPRVSLAALQWAADMAGQSYGVFTQRLTAEDEKRIQEEFEKHKREREAEAAAHRAQRVENDLPTPGGFIITEEDT